ncbi:uncharacterized protein LOC127748980 [Frankliniella occidentalis]|uniref:Uncharacterized protein LOC127748980 n=1 Tax=Frankliniella occidentalis TaxID=133901 RepID=A0A9C6WW22_FRAOC|nr:uncharacterized protein LOC127748980 [Frankliniella occidentalis]
MGTLLWGIVITTKFAFICIMGEQMSVENRRILAALQTGLANHPDMDFQRKGEISRFIHQIQMQDIRVKAFDSSSYYDLTTLKRVMGTLLWGIVITTKFAFICIMGEQMSVENRRILAALQTGLANHPDMDFQRKGEISRFIHQIQMQDIRVKAFDSSSYYDLTTLKRAVASVATFIIVLIQFAALVAQAASDGSVPKCNCQKC